MQKKFLSNLLLLVGLNLIIKPVSLFVIDANVQNYVGEQAYGIYFALLNLSFMFNMVLDLGINNFTTKKVAQYPKTTKKYFSHIIGYRWILFLLYAGITFSLGLFMQLDASEWNILLWLIVNQFFVTNIAYFRSHFQGLHLFKTDAIFSALDRFLLILFGAYLLFIKQDFTIIDFVYCQTFAYAFSFLFAWLSLRQKLGVTIPKWNFRFFIVVLKKSFPFALLVLLMMIYNRQDGFLLAILNRNGDFEVGVYAQAYRLIDAFFMFGMLFANLLFPIFSKLLKNDKSDLKPLIAVAFRILLNASVMLFLFSIFYGEMYLSWIYTTNIERTNEVNLLLLNGFIAMGFTLIFGTLLTANGNLKQLQWISFFAILINLAFNLILDPLYGAIGAALAFFCTQWFVGLMNYYYAQSLFQLLPSGKYALKFIGMYGTLACAMYLLPKSTVYLGIEIGIAGIMLLSLGMIQPQFLKSLMNKTNSLKFTIEKKEPKK